MTQSSLRQFLLTPPDQEAQAGAFGLPLVHMAFQLEADGHLHQTTGLSCQGGLMLVGARHIPGGGSDPRGAVRELVQTCIQRNFSGIVLDLEQSPTPYLARLIQNLDGNLAQRNRALFLPESYANYSGRAFLCISSAISGGSLRRRLEEAVDLYGADRIVLNLRRVAEDFYLPAPHGSGHPMTQEELAQRRKRVDATQFYSPDLCAHYFTYMSRETGAHFILFDDEESLRKKRELAASLGVSRFFLLYPEVADLLPALIQTDN